MSAPAQAAGKAAPLDPPVCIYQYAVPDGDAYFALAVRGDVDKLPHREIHTHAILVDTSASQAGTYRKRAMEIVNGYLTALGERDRVRLFAIDVKAQPMMDDFASPQSDECRKGLQALSTRVPLGATDMIGGLRTALAGLPAGVSATIVYVGDGMSAARLASFAELAELSGELRSRQIAVHSFAVGPQTDLEMLGTLAQQTGGVVLLDGARRHVECHGERLGVGRRGPGPRGLSFAPECFQSGSHRRRGPNRAEHGFADPRRPGNDLLGKRPRRRGAEPFVPVCRR